MYGEATMEAIGQALRAGADVAREASIANHPSSGGQAVSKPFPEGGEEK